MTTPGVGRSRRGFTLTELVTTMFVVGVLTVMVSMGSVAVLDSNESLAADSNVNRVLLAQQAFANEYGTYTGFPNDLGIIADVTVTVDVSDAPEMVSIALGTSGSLGISARRDDETCIMVSVQPLAAGGQVTSFPTEGQACDAATALGDEPAAESVSAIP